MLSPALTLPAGSQQTSLRINIRIYNYSGVSDDTLVQAEAVADRIYRRAGIGTSWFGCPLQENGLTGNPACELPGGPLLFSIRLLPHAMAKHFPVGNDVFGFALVPSDGGFGVLANVFADRVKEMRADDDLRKLLLGLVIAHELGHLLLGDTSHQAAIGIMHIPWKTRELEQAKRGGMSFMAKQCERIRAQVIARMADRRTCQALTMLRSGGANSTKGRRGFG